MSIELTWGTARTMVKRAAVVGVPVLGLAACADNPSTEANARKGMDFLQPVGCILPNGQAGICGARDKQATTNTFLPFPGVFAGNVTTQNGGGVAKDFGIAGLNAAANLGSAALLYGSGAGAGAAAAGAAGSGLTVVEQQFIKTQCNASSAANSNAQACTANSTSSAVRASGADIGTLSSGSGAAQAYTP